MKPSRPVSPESISPSPEPIPRPPSTSSEPDEELWLEDGNLILIAGDVEFKVYQGPLIAHSLVFENMLSFPQPDADPSTKLTTPVVHVPDSPDDLRYFLRTFFSGRKSLRTGYHDPTFDEVSACIRLGHKYEVDALVQANLAFLQKYYARDFDAWYALERVRPPGWTAAHAIGVVALARLVPAPALLPAALMDCCTLPGAALLRGLEPHPGAGAGATTLAQEDLARCIDGRVRMAQASARIAHRMFRADVAPGCRQTAACARVLLKLHNELAGAKPDVVACVDWYASWMAYVDSKDAGRELCMRCYRMLEGDRVKALQREVWAQLPEMMGVEVEGWVSPAAKRFPY